MPKLKPFPALRYADSASDMSMLLAPPYDVIDELMAVDLRARSPHNCVRLILPEGPPETRYADAAETLRDWIDGGILEHDADPAVYVYRQTYDLRGDVVSRHAVFCALELSPLDAGQVLPHERTHAGPKKDRLALTLTTRAQLSPIFMIARDPDGEVLSRARAATELDPRFDVQTPDGIRHELWVVPGSAAEEICALTGSRPVLIADGHHRYETALTAAQELGDNVKAAFLLVCLVSQQDPGLVVQPTHRVMLRAPDDSPDYDWREALEPAFHLEDLGDISAAEGEARAATAGGGILVVMPRMSGEAWLASPRFDRLPEPGIGEESRRLAPIVFDSLVLRRLYATDADGAAHAGLLKYSRSPEEAARAPEAGGCTFLLPPVALEDVWATAGAGGRMPQKSTYFEPKIPSGLLFRTLQG